MVIFELMFFVELRRSEAEAAQVMSRERKLILILKA